MPDPVNDLLYDFEIAQQVRWLQMSNAEAASIVAILNRVDKKLAAVIAEAGIADTTFGIRRTRALRKRVQELINSVHDDVAVGIETLVDDVAVLSADIEKTALTRVLPTNLDIVTPNPGVVSRIAGLKPFNGAVLGEWIEDLEANDLKRTWRAIQDGLIAGDSIQDIVAAVVGTKSLNFTDGIRQVSRRGTEMLIRTAITHAASVGREALWDENKDIIDKVRWVSTLDTRTSTICRFRDGKLYPVGEGPRPPAHPNCRSVTVAVTKSWREMGFDVDDLDASTRASMNGQVPSDKTYFQWLDGQSVTIQKQALGPARFKLWKEGGVSPESFSNNKGLKLTLNQLKKKMPEAFDKAFPE